MEVCLEEVVEAPRHLVPPGGGHGVPGLQQVQQLDVEQQGDAGPLDHLDHSQLEQHPTR